MALFLLLLLWCVDQLCTLGLLFDSVGLIRNPTLAMDRAVTNSCSHARMTGLSRALDFCCQPKKKSCPSRSKALPVGTTVCRNAYLGVCLSVCPRCIIFHTPTHSYTTNSVMHYIILYYILL